MHLVSFVWALPLGSSCLSLGAGRARRDSVLGLLGVGRCDNLSDRRCRIGRVWQVLEVKAPCMASARLGEEASVSVDAL
eukprot:2545456-Amphidinium_carterae.1